MPHQCTDCGRTFEDGSKEMLSGCPDCGGNKFQFIPADAVDESVEANSPGDPPSRSSSAGAVSKAATTVRDWVGGGSDDADRPSGGDRPTGDRPSSEWPKSATEDYDTPAEKAAARSGGEGADAATADASAEASTAEASSAGASTADAQSEAASTTHTDPSSDDGTIQGQTTGDEDNAQASARSDVVSPDELPDGTATPPAESSEVADESGSAPEPEAAAGGRGGSTAEAGAADVAAPSPEAADGRHEVADPADTQIEDRPDLDELREELNQQFESIKILNPGQYELNLMELYDREEYIISLREDGRYVIDVPDSWRGDD
ncbi:OapC/ArvC family zinc-ribbon domain-containing protein [Haloarchaeobius baliensis]|uniref:OapC/ArvC family zinc-ribbon domain-containing protein n=1 Tax=Haloarchaeobius baliensis TaxID=1670458 RepID=UPI003F883DA3